MAGEHSSDLPRPAPLVERVRAVVLGGSACPRLLQEAPIQSDVWLDFAEDPERPLELLLTPWGRLAAGEAARRLRDAIGGGGDIPIASLQGIVSVRVDVADFIRHILPVVRARREDQSSADKALVEIAALFDQQVRVRAPAPAIELPEENEAFIARVARARPTSAAQLLPTLACCQTVKADAAVRLFGLSCRDITWAVADDGIAAGHPAFVEHDATGCPQVEQTVRAPSRVVARYDFVGMLERLAGLAGGGGAAEPMRERMRRWLRVSDRMADDAAINERVVDTVDRLSTRLRAGRDLDWDLLLPMLTPLDDAGGDHGTAVAGIIGADWRDAKVEAVPGAYRGMCPDIRLIDLIVLPPQPGQVAGTPPPAGSEFDLIAALQFVRWWNNRSDARQTEIHGVNISLAVPHRADAYACGATPVCLECDRLSANGVVVVAPTGNHGHHAGGPAAAAGGSYAAISITDPGNARSAITVGSTHVREPHRYGVSYFSGRGPTADGRAKPDLVAPGERIPVIGRSTKTWRWASGTSFAAPHVSGAAALLLARHAELVGQPAEVKRILAASATDLGREHSFQGAGLLDTLRALQTP